MRMCPPAAGKEPEVWESIKWSLDALYSRRTNNCAHIPLHSASRANLTNGTASRTPAFSYFTEHTNITHDRFPNDESSVLRLIKNTTKYSGLPSVPWRERQGGACLNHHSSRTAEKRSSWVPIRLVMWFVQP